MTKCWYWYIHLLLFVDISTCKCTFCWCYSDQLTEYIDIIITKCTEMCHSENIDVVKLNINILISMLILINVSELQRPGPTQDQDPLGPKI